jgi:hypothetical protein
MLLKQTEQRPFLTKRGRQTDPRKYKQGGKSSIIATAELDGRAGEAERASTDEIFFKKVGFTPCFFLPFSVYCKCKRCKQWGVITNGHGLLFLPCLANKDRYFISLIRFKRIKPRQNNTSLNPDFFKARSVSVSLYPLVVFRYLIVEIIKQAAQAAEG